MKTNDDVLLELLILAENVFMGRVSHGTAVEELVEITRELRRLGLEGTLMINGRLTSLVYNLLFDKPSKSE